MRKKKEDKPEKIKHKRHCKWTAVKQRELERLAQTMRPPQIAKALHCSVATVRVHLNQSGIEFRRHRFDGTVKKQVSFTLSQKAVDFIDSRWANRSLFIDGLICRLADIERARTYGSTDNSEEQS